ncbi:MAG TPA: tetratricopeptide repeat protein [Burkholderiales bacterium]|nr:tetratricopeptide repeat protein [Burkholderiales bacterium]
MFMRYFVLLFVTLFAALNAACAQTSNQPHSSADGSMVAQHDENESLDERVRRVLGKSPVAANSDLDSELFFKFLVAEIAGQRGDVALASETYAELARASRDARVARRATEISLYAKRTDLALQSARIWHDADPESLAALRTLADLLIQAGELDAARPLIAEVLAKAPEGPAASLMQLYQVCSNHPDRQAVQTLIRDLTTPYAGLPEAQYALAQATFAAGDLKQALRSADQALNLRPDWQQGALLKAHLLGQTDRSEAIAYMQAFLQAYPDAVDVRLNYARALVSERRYAEAKGEFQTLLATNPKNANLAFTLGLLSAQIGDAPAADQQFRSALSLGYGDPDSVYFQLGQINEKLERPDEAARWYRSVQAGDQFVAAQSRYALMLARNDGVEQARLYLHSLDVLDDNQRVQLIQAEAHMLREVREYRQSYAVLQQALDERPEHRALLYDVALAAEKVDRLDVAEEQLLRLIALEPDSAQAYNALGYTLADRTERFDEARDYIVKALALAPDDPFILDSMGWVEYRLGNNQEGIRYLRRAYEIQPDPEIAAHLGEVLWVSGAEEEARQIWHETASQHPGNETLQQVMREFLGS